MRVREPAVRPPAGDHLRQGVHDASVQAPDDRQHGGSRGRVDRRRARLPRDLLRAEQRHADARRRLRHRNRRWRWWSSISVACRGGASRCRATSRRSRRRRSSASHGRASPGRCRRWWSRTTSPSTAIRTPIRCTSLSKILSDGQSSRIYRSLVYEKQAGARGLRRGQPHRASEPVLRRGDRAARATGPRPCCASCRRSSIG